MARSKREVYREVFVSPFEMDTEGDALKVLAAIRECHSAMYGWKEIRGFVEKLPNGKYRAVREHAKYAWFSTGGCMFNGIYPFVLIQYKV